MATNADSSCWTIVASDDSADQPSVQDLKTSLEKGTDAVKAEAMKRLLSMMFLSLSQQPTNPTAGWPVTRCRS
jgi:hypothetical protein